MNDHPPLEPVGDASLEARIVAWVLGEATAFEAGELERLCDERPELLVFRRRMRALHGLLSEAESAEPDEAWKLPPDKRAKIEELFGESQPEQDIPILRPAAPSRSLLKPGRLQQRWTSDGSAAPSRWFAKTILTAAACLMFGLLYRFGFAGIGSSYKLATNEEQVAKSTPQLSRASVDRVEALELASSAGERAQAWYGRSDENGRIAGEKRSQTYFDADRKTAAGVDYSYKAKAAQAVADTESLAAAAKPKIGVVREFNYPAEYQPPELPNSVGNGLALGESTPATPTGGLTGEIHAGYNSQYLFRGKDLSGDGADATIAPAAEAAAQQAGLAFGGGTSDPGGKLDLYGEVSRPSSLAEKQAALGLGFDGSPNANSAYDQAPTQLALGGELFKNQPLPNLYGNMPAPASSLADSDGETDPFASSQDKGSKLAARLPVSESKPGEPTGDPAFAAGSATSFSRFGAVEGELAKKQLESTDDELLGRWKESQGESRTKDRVSRREVPESPGAPVDKDLAAAGQNAGAGQNRVSDSFSGFGGGSGGGLGGQAKNAPMDEVSSLKLEKKSEDALASDAGSISDFKITGALDVASKSKLSQMEGAENQIADGLKAGDGTTVNGGLRSGDVAITRNNIDAILNNPNRAENGSRARQLADGPSQPVGGTLADLESADRDMPAADPVPAPPVVAAPAKPAAAARPRVSGDDLTRAEPESRRLARDNSVADQKADASKSMAAEPERSQQALQSLEKVDKSWELTDGGVKKPAPTAQFKKITENAEDDRGAGSAREMEYKIEQDKIQLESQLKSLLNYSSDQLLTYASGLDLPENSIKTIYPSYLEQKRALDEMKTKGFAEEHPAVKAQKEQIENTKKQLEQGVTSLRETLMAQQDMASERLAKVKILSSEKKNEAIDLAVDSQDYLDAKRELDSAQEMLNTMKAKLIGETIQERIPSSSIVIHEDPVVEKPGWLSLDRRYQSTAVVQVKPRTPGITVLGRNLDESNGQGLMMQQFFATEFEIAKSRNILTKVAEQLELANKWEISKEKAVEELQKSIELSNRPGTDLIDIKVKNDDATVASNIAAEVAKAYKNYRTEIEGKDAELGLQALRKAVRDQEDKVEERRKLLTTIVRTKGIIPSTEPNMLRLPDAPKPAPTPPPIPTDETSASGEAFSTFSLHVSDASFKVAKAALDRGERPDPESVRPEEFYNAFDYGDPTPAPGEPVACAIEQAAHPILPQRNLVRIAMRTGAAGRAASQPLNLTVLLDHSGSMEREDRHEGLNQAIVQLASLLKAGDTITVAGFSRTPRLMADRLPGERAKELIDIVRNTPSEGGTNLEEALKLGGDLALRQKNPAAQNRIVLLTDGAANLGNAKPEDLAERIRALRQQGISFDAAGLGAGGVNDRMLETLTRDGNGRYYLIDQPSDADANFARQLAGAFRPAAENVKVQVHFNPARVGRYKLIGFEKHRLKTEDFRNDKVDAAELAAEEAGVALYQVETLPQGTGEIGEASVRFKDTSTGQMVEQTWTIAYDEKTPAFDQAAPSMQLASLAALSAEKLRGGPLAEAIDFQSLTPQVAKVRAHYATSKKVGDLIEMIGKLK